MPAQDINIGKGVAAEDLLGNLLQPSEEGAAEAAAPPVVFERMLPAEDEEALRQGDFHFQSASPEVHFDGGPVAMCSRCLLQSGSLLSAPDRPTTPFFSPP